MLKITATDNGFRWKIYLFTWRTILVLGIICLSFITASSQVVKSDWKLRALIAEDSVDNAQLYFADQSNGYLVGYKKPHPEDFGIIRYKHIIFYRTLDGGITWQKIDVAKIYGADSNKYKSYPYGIQFRLSTASANSCVVSNDLGGGVQRDTLTFYWSKNNGSSWSRFNPTPFANAGDFRVEAIPAEHEVIALRTGSYDLKKNAGKFFLSATNGASFDEMRWDSVLLKNISYGGFGSSGAFNFVNNHAFGRFDERNWLVVVSDSDNSGGNPEPLRPYKMTSIFSSDGGRSWQAYHNSIPNFPSQVSAVYGNTCCVRNSSSVYLFTASWEASEGGSVYSADGLGWGFPWYGINFLYSSDYGKTWGADSSFAHNRRGYEAVAPGEVWITFSSNPSPNENTFTNLIAHTLDNGKNWQIDSTGLFEDGYYDGRSITFSDKNHGWIYAQSLDRKKIAIFKYAPNDEVTMKSSSTVIGLSRFPNPADQKLTITSSVGQISGISVFNVLGQPTNAELIKGSDPYCMTLSTGSLPGGLYFAKVYSRNGIGVISFLVRHPN